MKFELKPDQEAYLQMLVSRGAYRSLEEAIDAMLTPSEDDSWAKPYITEALAQIDAGEAAPWDVNELRDELIASHPELANSANPQN